MQMSVEVKEMRECAGGWGKDPMIEVVCRGDDNTQLTFVVKDTKKTRDTYRLGRRVDVNLQAF